MSKFGSTGTLTIFSLDYNSSLPIYKQISRELKVAIISGRLAGGARLPATRTLASELGVSRNTIMSVFEELAAEGYITSQVGNGTFVSDKLPEEHLLPSEAIRSVWREPSTGPGFLSARGQQMAELSGQPLANEIILSRPFCADLPAVEAFPIEAWGRLMRKNWQRIMTVSPALVQPAGYVPLQQSVARHLNAARFVRCVSSQVLITSGSQQSLDLTARLLLDPGDTVWVEDPGYIAARSVLTAAGAKVVPVTVDGEGLNVEKGRVLEPHPRAIYISPSRQYPLGVTMSASRRLEIIEFANKVGAWIIEDDYDSDYRYDGVPLPAIQSLQKADRLFYLGSFSKSLLPAIRLGYLVIPRELITTFSTALSLTTRPNSMLEQMTLHEFISTGQFATHVRRMRHLYSERQPVLLKQLQRLLGDVLEVEPTSTGTHLTAYFKIDVDDVKYCDLALARGISLRPLSIHYVNEQKRKGLIIGFASASVPRIIAAVERLAAMTREFLELEQASASPSIDPGLPEQASRFVRHRNGT
ncbi:MAG: PLP-dependent aminotransferase family protein [Bradyrhizobium sp.]